MAKTYDAILKHLVEAYPAAWLAGVGWPATGPVRIIDADVSTVTAGADKVFRVEETQPWVAHLELQAGPETELADRAHLYNVLLRRRHRLAVRSAIVLLRRGSRFAPAEWVAGTPRSVRRLGAALAVSRDPSVAAAGGGVAGGRVGVAALAPLTDDAADRLPDVIRRMDERLKAEAPAARDTLETAAYFLMGLRYSLPVVEELWKGVRGMEESSTYQYVIEKGEQKGRKEARKATLVETLLDLGALRFGSPTPAIAAALNAEEDHDRLVRMRHRLLDATDWKDLISTP